MDSELKSVIPLKAPTTSPTGSLSDGLPRGDSDRYALGFQPPTIRSEEEILADWTESGPTVTIVCPTFNHVRFIADAIRGFLGQRTSFPLQIIVRDDASTDGTAEIVRRFADRYPRLITAVLEPTNTYRQGRRPFESVSHLIEGKFVASCEGDDYWTSSDKLQQQVRLLQSRPDLAIAASKSYVIADDHPSPYCIVPGNPPGDTITSDDIMLRGVWPKTLTRVVRREHLERYQRDVPREANCDCTLVRYTVCHPYGDACPIGFVDRPMAVYREHAGGIWAGASSLQKAMLTLRYIECQLMWSKQRQWQTMLHSEASTAAATVLNDCQCSNQQAEVALRVLELVRKQTPIRRRVLSRMRVVLAMARSLGMSRR